MARSRKRSSSLIQWFLLMLVLINSVYGRAINSKKIKQISSELQSENCPTHKDSKFPDSVRVLLQIIPTNRSHDRPQDVGDRSLSPWDYRINEDSYRFPPAIAEASCRHHACLNATGRGLNYGLNSVPIQQEILVLRRRQTGCRQTYWLAKQIITVGCTCAFPTTHTNTDLGKDGQN
ncbi:interleukin-17F-like [Heteronotia binoei]|uniref:interleukin-17F-like n=1 Tax=Heteronotia binoei TaxID=13085 RepID=UPI00292EFA72|nr:interleukin-17F-like [Heteronotia binoei]